MYKTLPTLNQLYEADETAWLEAMAELIQLKLYDQLDYSNLQEFLTEMAKRDKREVTSRLTLLIAHQLKWDYQSAKRSTSWKITIESQRQELLSLFENASLRHYAELKLQKSYQAAIRLAMAETDLAEDAFPANSPYTLDSLGLTPE